MKHQKKTCKSKLCRCNLCLNVSLDLRRIFDEWILRMNEWLQECVCIRGFGLGSGFVYLIPAELLCCLTGTCTNSLNHGRIIDRVADFSLAPLQLVPQTPLMNANWVFFFFIHAFHILRDSCKRLWNWHLCYVWATACQFWSLSQWS